jgi:hypothetical protein
MSALLLDENLRASPDGAEVRNIARTRTLSTLRRLDGDREGILLQFLYESQLIIADCRIVDLPGIDTDTRNG